MLAGIYSGRSPSGTTRRSKKLNPGVKLPGTPITPVYRSDGSGDTYAFTNYLSKVSPAWKNELGYATTVSFGAGRRRQRQRRRHLGGGVDDRCDRLHLRLLPDRRRLGAVAVQNKAGIEFPNLKNISAAAEMVKKVPANNELHIMDPPKKFDDAYPISTFTYAIVPHGAPQKACSKRSSTTH